MTLFWERRIFLERDEYLVPDESYWGGLYLNRARRLQEESKNFSRREIYLIGENLNFFEANFLFAKKRVCRKCQKSQVSNVSQ